MACLRRFRVWWCQGSREEDEEEEAEEQKDAEIMLRARQCQRLWRLAAFTLQHPLLPRPLATPPAQFGTGNDSTVNHCSFVSVRVCDI